MNPVDALLNMVEWTTVDDVTPNELHDGLPYATHKGILEINGVSFRCVQLNDGRRLINPDDFNKFFGIGDD